MHDELLTWKNNIQLQVAMQDQVFFISWERYIQPKSVSIAAGAAETDADTNV
jgi:hypothetical protein